MEKLFTVMPIPKVARVFRVECGEKTGLCFSYYDFFKIFWDDGIQLKTIELSLHGIKKIRE